MICVHTRESVDSHTEHEHDAFFFTRGHGATEHGRNVERKNLTQSNKGIYYKKSGMIPVARFSVSRLVVHPELFCHQLFCQTPPAQIPEIDDEPNVSLFAPFSLSPNLEHTPLATHASAIQWRHRSA